MTLMEVLIATFLTMILLTTITFFYRQVTLMSKESEKLQHERFKLAYTEKRLFNVIPRIISPTNINNDFYFYTSEALQNNSTSLVFTYDHRISLGKNQSNHQLGRLYIDDKNRLILSSLISPKLWELNPNLTLKKEVLMDNVSNLSFEFYVPSEKSATGMLKKVPASVEISPENSWHQSWKASYNQLPSMIKIHMIQKIENQEIPIVFAFPLPNSSKVIIYEN